MLNIRFEEGSQEKSQHLINLRGEMENMCREAEKCRVRSRSSSRPTGLFSDNQSTGCLAFGWLTARETGWHRGETESSSRKPPQGRPALTQTHTLFLEIDWKSTAFWDSEAPCFVQWFTSVSQHPLPLLLSFYLTAWHSASFTLSLMSLFDTSIKAAFSGTIILLRSSTVEKKAKEWEGNKKGLFFCLAAYISSRLWQRDFHRINGKQEKVKWAGLWEILQTWKKNTSYLSNFSALLFGLLERSTIKYI